METNSELTEKILKPSLKSIPSVLQNMNNLVNILENTKYSKEALVLTLDVKSLYEGIPIEEGITTAIDFYLRHTGVRPIPSEDMRKL